MRLHYLGGFFLIVACSPAKKYQDHHLLEQPPSLQITAKNIAPAVTQTQLTTGLNDAVTRIDAQHLHLKQSFEPAWTTLGNTLTFNQIKISDRNHDTGTYYVHYDPDQSSYKTSDLIEELSALFTNNYAESTYKITLTQRSTGVIITAEKMEEKDRLNLLDDGDEISFEDSPDDGANKLIHQLYTTLKHDIPLD